MMEAVDVLQAAKGLLSDPKRWIRGATAKNTRGQKSWANAADAICWCMMGAVMKVTGSTCFEMHLGIAAEALAALRSVCPGGVPQFNDAPTTTHEMVLQKFDLAIVEASHMEKSC